jgi:hypothetical protein
MPRCKHRSYAFRRSIKFNCTGRALRFATGAIKWAIKCTHLHIEFRGRTAVSTIIGLLLLLLLLLLMRWLGSRCRDYTRLRYLMLLLLLLLLLSWHRLLVKRITNNSVVYWTVERVCAIQRSALPCLWRRRVVWMLGHFVLLSNWGVGLAVAYCQHWARALYIFLR